MKEVDNMRYINIISYKHEGELHRVWEKAIFLYEEEDMVVLINDKVKVIDGDGRYWKTREPAVCFFFKKYWFNVISMIRKDNIYYYCNLSSPYVIDSEGLKYIDYDLDIKLFPDGEMVVVDKDEYQFNIDNLHYPEEITKIINKHLNILTDMIKERKKPFNDEYVREWYQYYLEKVNENERSTL